MIQIILENVFSVVLLNFLFWKQEEPDEDESLDVICTMLKLKVSHAKHGMVDEWCLG